MAETTFTFKDASGTTKTALAGQNGSSQLAPAATLYDASGAELKGQKARAASLPVVLSSEDAALLDGLETTLTAIQALIDALTTPADTQPISALALPLPSGAATANNQTTANTSLASILSALQGTLAVSAASLPLPSGAATEATLAAIQTLIDALTTPSDTQPISAASLPLPTGAATQTTLASVLSALQSTLATSAAQSGTWTVQPGNTANTTPWLVNPRPATSGGLSIYKNLDIDESGQNIKGSAGQVFGWYIFNAAAATRYVKLYNKASAPTVGTDTPVMTIPIPAGAAANVEFSLGIAFSLGIGIGAATGVADNSTGAPAANDCIVTIFYA